jgi:tungstate transport system ATP-binding protein
MPDPVVKLHKLQKSIEGRMILEDISFSSYPSEILTIIGPNGSGKTTILRILNLLIKESKGDVEYHFSGLPSISNPQNNKEKLVLKRQMHLLFQKPVVFSGSVLENCLVCGPLRGMKFSRIEAMEALERVEIAHLYRQSAHTLSGGEMTRLSLARAWLIKPQLLLLDEPSANLDPKGIKLFEELICSMASDFSSSIVLVTQDLFEARRISHRVGLLLHGKIIEIQKNPDFFQQACHNLTRQFISGCLVL